MKSDYTNPLVLIKLYRSVVLPTVLLGSEIWNNLINQNISILNRFQHNILLRSMSRDSKQLQDQIFVTAWSVFNRSYLKVTNANYFSWENYALWIVFI